MILAPYIAVAPIFWGDRQRISLGKNVYLTNCVLNARSGNIVIGDDVFFGHNCLVLTGKHDEIKRGAERQLAVPESGRDIVIHRGVWIASGVIIIGPCEIGESAVIAAGTIVRANVPANTLYGGNPAKVLRQLS
jgi:acetyltransferase-like isoleucine patch superfamily enzyme